jgi:hypothetical protein
MSQSWVKLIITSSTTWLSPTVREIGVTTVVLRPMANEPGLVEAAHRLAARAGRSWSGRA